MRAVRGEGRIPWEFNGAIATPMRSTPGEIQEAQERLAKRMSNEEHAELNRAKTLEEKVDAICDKIFVDLGYACRLGVNIDGPFNEVFRANMAKLGGPKRSDGKQLKPPGWIPPNIAGELEKQGWRR